MDTARRTLYVSPVALVDIIRQKDRYVSCMSQILRFKEHIEWVKYDYPQINVFRVSVKSAIVLILI